MQKTRSHRSVCATPKPLCPRTNSVSSQSTCMIFHGCSTSTFLAPIKRLWFPISEQLYLVTHITQQYCQLMPPLAINLCRIFISLKSIPLVVVCTGLIGSIWATLRLLPSLVHKKDKKKQNNILLIQLRYKIQHIHKFKTENVALSSSYYNYHIAVYRYDLQYTIHPSNS